MTRFQSKYTRHDFKPGDTVLAVPGTKCRVFPDHNDRQLKDWEALTITNVDTHSDLVNARRVTEPGLHDGPLFALNISDLVKPSDRVRINDTWKGGDPSLNVGRVGTLNGVARSSVDGEPLPSLRLFVPDGGTYPDGGLWVKPSEVDVIPGTASLDITPYITGFGMAARAAGNRRRPLVRKGQHWKFGHMDMDATILHVTADVVQFRYFYTDRMGGVWTKPYDEFVRRGRFVSETTVLPGQKKRFKKGDRVVIRAGAKSLFDTFWDGAKGEILKPSYAYADRWSVRGKDGIVRFFKAEDLSHDVVTAADPSAGSITGYKFSVGQKVTHKSGPGPVPFYTVSRIASDGRLEFKGYEGMLFEAKYFNAAPDLRVGGLLFEAKPILPTAIGSLVHAAYDPDGHDYLLTKNGWVNVASGYTLTHKSSLGTNFKVLRTGPKFL